MINVDAKVKIPFLWGKAVFKKSNWSQINLIVGPNGSGKTLLAEKLALHFEKAGYTPKIIKVERNYLEQIHILHENQYVKEKIEKVLSNMFGKSIIFIEDVNGILIPIVKNKAWNVEYLLDDAECHGLREIISLLICLYNKDDSDCIFFDEPELHLHPQMQSFFMNEIRKEIKNSARRIFFLISHSPFFIDLRATEDLTGVIACHINKAPTSIENLSDDDEILFRRFLPRFNTYHKQFFFSDNQIFVEGYTDQQMFTHLLSYIEDETNVAGTGIIDVGGKDELGVFCKICQLFGTNSRIITDLDSLFSGKLRDVVVNDERVKMWLIKQNEKQMFFYRQIFSKKESVQQVNMEKLILRLEQYLIEIGNDLKFQFKNIKNKSVPEKLNLLLLKLNFLQEKHENVQNVDTYKTVIMQAVNLQEKELTEVLSDSNKKNLPIVKNLFQLILAGFEAARVYILHRGCIEHYYTQSSNKYMPVSGKDKLFRNELDFMQGAHRKTILKKYSDLIDVLKKATSL